MEDVDMSKISTTVVKSAHTHQEIKLESLWENNACVIIFLRRFGCFFCRLSAKEISAIHPTLKAHNIRLVGIGFDELGAPDFVHGGFFTGEVYLDPLKETYTGLDFKRYGVLGLVKRICTKTFKNSLVKARREKIPGNNQGDTFQQGGVVVITSKAEGAQVLLAYKQDNPADYISNEQVLSALSIKKMNI